MRQKKEIKGVSEGRTYGRIGMKPGGLVEGDRVVARLYVDQPPLHRSRFGPFSPTTALEAVGTTVASLATNVHSRRPSGH